METKTIKIKSLNIIKKEVDSIKAGYSVFEKEMDILINNKSNNVNK